MTYFFLPCSKKVSKSLESDFSNKMNHLLRTVLHKQGQQRIMDDFGGYYDERMYWRQNDQIQNTEHVVSAPCSLDPVSHLAAHPQETWQRSSIGSQHHDNRNFLVSLLLFNICSGKFTFLLYFLL
jgi:protein neuralized